MKVRELQVYYRQRDDFPELAVARKGVVTPKAAAQFLGPILSHETVEVFGALFLTTKHKVIAYHEVSRGTLDEALVHPREVFKAAFLANAAGVILAHNHPSGQVTPSPEDIDLTERLQKAGALLGVDVLDHLIIGWWGKYLSFKEESLLR